MRPHAAGPHAAESLGRALQPLLDPGTGDDLRAVAEAQLRSDGSVVIPEAIQLRVEAADLLPDLRVVLGGEPMPELATLLAQALDLRMNFRGSCHVD